MDRDGKERIFNRLKRYLHGSVFELRLFDFTVKTYSQFNPLLGLKSQTLS